MQSGVLLLLSCVVGADANHSESRWCDQYGGSSIYRVYGTVRAEYADSISEEIQLAFSLLHEFLRLRPDALTSRIFTVSRERKHAHVFRLSYDIPS